MQTHTASLHFDEYPPEMRLLVVLVASNLLAEVDTTSTTSNLKAVEHLLLKR
jgi:hypothetical protein